MNTALGWNKKGYIGMQRRKGNIESCELRIMPPSEFRQPRICYLL